MIKNDDILEIRNLDTRNCYQFRWQLTSLCNYNCDFCIQGNREKHIRDAQNESSKTRADIALKLKEIMDNLSDSTCRRIKMYLIGGEVTILKDFQTIFETLVSSTFHGEIHFYITTNGSAKIELYKNLFDILKKYNHSDKPRRLNLDVSYYKKYAAQQEFVSKILAIADCAGIKKTFGYFPPHLFQKFHPQVNLSAGFPILTDEDYKNYLGLKKELKKRLVRVEPIVIRNYPVSFSEETKRDLQKTKTGKYKIEVLDKNGRSNKFRNIRALGVALEDRESFCPEGYYCDAGTHGFSVDQRGNVNRCQAIGNTMSMGSIFDSSFHLLEEPEICTSDHCSCSLYGHIFKG